METASRIAVGVVALITVLVMPVTARQSMPPVHSIGRDALRRAVNETPPQERTAADKARAASDRDWKDLQDIEGEQILLTLKGAPPVTRYLVADSVTQTGFLALNLTDPQIRAELRSVLADAAWSHPECFRSPAPNGEVRLDTHVSVAAGSVLVDGNKLFDVASVVEPVARASVVEIRHVHRATKRGAAWGPLFGLAAGVGIIMTHCGVHWNRETESCGNLTGAWLIFGPGFGTGIGAAIGAGYTIATVVYRAPDFVPGF